MKGTVKIFITGKEQGKTKAFASLTIEDSICITGLKVVDGKSGLFVSFPQYKNNEGEYKDIVFPITNEFRKKLTKLVLSEYERVISTNTSDSSFDTL